MNLLSTICRSSIIYEELQKRYSFHEYFIFFRTEKRRINNRLNVLEDGYAKKIQSNSYILTDCIAIFFVVADITREKKN